MTKRFVLAVAMILVGVGSAFGQAAAEGAMIHSMSAGAAAKAGTSLGRSTNNAASGLAGRLNGAMSSSSSSHASTSSHAIVRPAAPVAAGTKPAVPCVQPDSKQAGQAGTNAKLDCQTKAPAASDQDKTKYKKF